MIPPFLMASTSSITMQSLRKIAQCAPAVGANSVVTMIDIDIAIAIISNTV